MPGPHEFHETRRGSPSRSISNTNIILTWVREPQKTWLLITGTR